MLISGQGWYGYDIEQLRPHQKSYGYMSYEVALGLQTEPADGNVYDRLFGYPTLYFGASVASMGDFQFYDHTKFPNLGDTFVGFAIKSHSIKAEYLEFSLGWRLP